MALLFQHECNEIKKAMDSYEDAVRTRKDKKTINQYKRELFKVKVQSIKRINTIINEMNMSMMKLQLKENKKNKDKYFEQENPSQIYTENRLQNDHRNTSLYCSGWAKILAEPRIPGTKFINGKKRQNKIAHP